MTTQVEPGKSSGDGLLHRVVCREAGVRASAATAAGSIPWASLTTDRAEVRIRSAMPPSGVDPRELAGHAVHVVTSPARPAEARR